MTRRTIAIAITLALWSTGARATSAAMPAVTPVQAKLTGDLALRFLHPGSLIHAQVATEWNGADCFLRKGAILEGQVLSVVPHSKTVQDSEVHLAFTRAQCGQPDMSALDLTIVAVAAPPVHQDHGILDAPLPMVSMGGQGGIISLKMAQMGLRLPTASTGLDMPELAGLKVGDVMGISRLKLSMRAGGENSSVLTMKGRDVSLEAQTMLLLVPTQSMFSPSPGAPQGNAIAQPTRTSIDAVPAPAPELPPPPADDVDRCTLGSCDAPLSSGNMIEAGKASAAISIRELGYIPRPSRIMAGFDHDEALAYLGPDELLVAFKLHILATRHDLGSSGSTRRIIRAALVDTRTSKVTHTVDWDLPDFQDFLWPLAEGRILVHVGSELRVYGHGLKIENRMPLDGPLAFVRLSPNGNFVAVGIVHERHAAQLHTQLLEESGNEPEEDISVAVLNRKFETVAKSTISSTVMPPTLLDEGQAVLLAQPDRHYRIGMLTWDGHASTVARFTSGCTPRMSSIAPDLIFLISCDKQAGFRDYRLLHSDGKPVLTGRSTLNDLGHAVESSANQQFFVVKSVESSSAVHPDATFSGDDLVAEKLAVYRTTDGKHMMTVRVGLPSSSTNGYALSPDGSQLAVFNREQISVYSMPN